MYWVSAAAWSMAVVENATIFGVEVAVDTTLTQQDLTGLSELPPYLSLRTHIPGTLYPSFAS